MLLDPSAEKANAAPFHFVASADPASLGGHFVAHLAVLGADSANRRSSDHAVGIGDSRPAYGFQAGVLHERGVGLDHLEVSLLEHYFLARSLSAGLLAGLLWPGYDDALAEGVEAVHEDMSEAAPVSGQQRDRHDAPDDAEHGEETASAVALQRRPGCENDLCQHCNTPCGDGRLARPAERQPG